MNQYDFVCICMIIQSEDSYFLTEPPSPKNLLGEETSFTCDASQLQVKQPNILIVSDMHTQTGATKTAGRRGKKLSVLTQRWKTDEARRSEGKAADEENQTGRWSDEAVRAHRA